MVSGDDQSTGMVVLSVCSLSSNHRPQKALSLLLACWLMALVPWLIVGLLSSLLWGTISMILWFHFKQDHVMQLIIVEPIAKSKPFHSGDRIALHSRIRLLFVVDSPTLSFVVWALTPRQMASIKGLTLVQMC